MKIIEKHYANNINETGLVILYPQETNILLTENFKFVAFNATYNIGFKFSKTDPLKIGKQCSERIEGKSFYISNNSKKEITIKYSVLH